MFCKLLDITNCKILLTYVHLAVILCILKAEDGQGRPKNVAYNVRFNKFFFGRQHINYYSFVTAQRGELPQNNIMFLLTFVRSYLKMKNTHLKVIKFEV